MTQDRLHPTIAADQSRHTLPPIEVGTLSLYRLFELGDTIDLESAHRALSMHTVRRENPPRVRQSESIQIAQTPLEVDLGAVRLELAGASFEGTIRASVYDLGAVAITLLLPLTAGTTWETVADLFAAAQEPPRLVGACIENALGELESRLLPAITRPGRAALDEDYAVLLIQRLTEPVDASVLAQHPTVRAALLGERRALSADAAALVTGMSYYLDDLALLSWNGALVIEPDPLAAETVQDLLEFANIELLLLRSYEADLEAQISRLNQRIAATRHRLYIPLVGRYNALLREAQVLVIDVTEVTERIANAFKVTDDVYWNRLYEAALATLRVSVWRDGVEHRMGLLRESYRLLQEQAESDRGASLEIIVIVLIFFEIVWALFTH